MSVQETIRRLKCILTDEEISAKVDGAAKYEAERTREEAELATLTSKVKDKKAAIAHLDSSARANLKAVGDGFEMRDVECETYYCSIEKKMLTRRKDLDEVIDSRGLTQDERQLHIPNTNASPAIP